MLIVHAFVPTMSASGGQTYTNDVDVCNKGGQKIWVAVAEEENLWLSPDNWRISGWKEVRPKDCVEVHSSYHSLEVKERTPYLAFSQVGTDGNLGIVKYSPRESFFGDDHIKSRSKHFCVHPTDHFKYEFSGNGMSACRPPFALAEFSIMVLGAYLRDSKITVNIDPSDAALVTPFNSPPSATVAPKEEAKSEPNLFTELLKIYEEGRKEERRASRERPVDPPKSEKHAVLPKPGWLGITIQEVSPESAQTFNLPEGQQAKVIVTAIVNDGPASKSDSSFDNGFGGVLPGDVLLAIRPGGNKWVTLRDVKHAEDIMGTIKSGAIVELWISRQGKTMSRFLVARDRPTEKG